MERQGPLYELDKWHYRLRVILKEENKMAKNEKDEAKKVGEAIFNKYAKDAEAEHMSEIEQMLKDAGVDMDALAEEGDDEEGQDGES
jgi:hypothetical protein